MIKKIQKHSSIALRRIKQNSELSAISNYDNEMLQRILKSFLMVKYSDYSPEDLAAFKACEEYRQKLLNDDSLISYEIFGSNSKIAVKEICSQAASPKPWSQFLYCLTKNLNSEKVLEIGTNVGISGNYILQALKHQPQSQFVTMEGLPQLCELSTRQFATIISENYFNVVQGLYENTFPQVLNAGHEFDTIFIDGNHKKDPTLDYFQKLKLISNNPAVFIFDDINWSAPMKEAWEIIKQDDTVNYSIDLYKQGLVVVDKNDRNKNVEFKLHLAY
jgi:predicted O-methyltransferase YrrM